MNQVIRISDQKVYDTIASAAASIGTPSNYLAKCIRAQKPCKGEYFEFFRGGGYNSPPEALPRLMAQSRIKEPAEDELEWEDSIQSILFAMKEEADKFDISLTQMFKEFVKRTKDVFAE